MPGHLSNQDLRDFENGKALTEDQKKHLKDCFACHFYLKAVKAKRAERFGAERPSWWRRLISAISSIFSKKGTKKDA